MFLFLVVLGFPLISKAQEVILSGETLYHTNFGIINSSILNSSVEKAESKARPAGGKKLAPAALRFTRSELLSQQIQSEFLQRLASEGTANSYKAMFTDNRLRNEFDQLLSGYGFSSKNIGDVLAAELIIHWQIIHDQNFSDTRGMNAVKSAVADALLQGNALGKATGQEKQRMAESYGYQSMVAMKLYQQLKNAGNKEGLQKLSNTLAEGMKNTGIDLRIMQLTSRGFVKK